MKVTQQVHYHGADHSFGPLKSRAGVREVDFSELIMPDLRTATSYAARLDQATHGSTPQALSVYGALLLRGAVAAAQADDRDMAAGLLAEAREAGRRLGREGNYCWTAFGPVNADLHGSASRSPSGTRGRPSTWPALSPPRP